MAIVTYEHPIHDISGAIEKHGIINRRKHYRDDNGKIIFEGKPEAYAVKHPRDFEKTPPQGEELAHHNRWREACLQTYAELHDPDKRKQWQDRFQKQLRTKDPEAPIDPRTHRRKHYHRLDAFVRAIIYTLLKATQPDKNP